MWAIIWLGSCLNQPMNEWGENEWHTSEIAWNKTLIEYCRLNDATKLRIRKLFIMNSFYFFYVRTFNVVLGLFYFSFLQYIYTSTTRTLMKKNHHRKRKGKKERNKNKTHIKPSSQPVSKRQLVLIPFARSMRIKCFGWVSGTKHKPTTKLLIFFPVLSFFYLFFILYFNKYPLKPHEISNNIILTRT